MGSVIYQCLEIAKIYTEMKDDSSHDAELMSSGHFVKHLFKYKKLKI